MVGAKLPDNLGFSVINGEMAERVRAHDWTTTPLGPIAQWPQSLKTAVGMVLLSPVPIVMLWGDDGIMIYNDAYSVFAGGRHPQLLGSKVREGWPEVADFNDNVMKVGLAGGTLAYRDQELTLHRTGKPEPVWMNLDYSPILDDAGAPAGVMAIVIETTERVLAERKVRAQRERLEQMFAQAPSFMAQLDGPDHIYTLTNNAYQQLIGHRDVIGKSIRAAWPELEGQGFFELLDDVYRKGEPFVGRSAPVALQRKPGGALENVLLDFLYQPLKSADGKVTGIFVEGIDVTGAQRAQRALGESEQRFHDIADATPVLIWMSDATKACIWFNKTWLDFTGRTMAQEAGNGWAEGVHPDDYERCLKTYVTAFDARQPFRMYYRLRRHDGEWRMIDDSGVPRFAEDGTFLGYIGSCIDVDDERTADDALRRSEERLRLATENSSVGLWDIDAEHAISFTYSRSSSAFVMDQENRVPMEHLLSRLHPDDAAKLEAAYTAARDPAQRAMMDVEYRVMPLDDQPLRWVKVRGRGVFDAHSACTHVSGTAIDITTLKQAQVRDAVMAELAERFRPLEAPDDLAFAAAEVLGHTLNVSRVGYGTIDPEREIITIRRDWNAPGVQSLAGTLSFRDYGSYIEELKRGITVVISDAREEPRTAATAAALEGINARALVNMPVTEQTGLVALLYLNNDAVRVWSEEELELVREVAERTRVAVERRRAEIALAKSEELLRLATENAEIGMWDMDVVNNRNHPHPRVKAMFGIPPDENPTAEEYFALVHKDDIARVSAAYAEAFDPVKRAFYDVEYRVNARDRVQRWIQARGRGVFSASGECLRVVGTAIDMTRQRETADAFRRSEEQLRLATEYAEVGLWDIDIVNDIVYWPPRVNAMFGFAPDEQVTMKQFRACLHPEDKRRTIEAILDACDPDKRGFYDTEYRIVSRKDRGVSWLAAKGRTIFDDSGRAVRMLGIIIDITARKEIEQRLTELNETLEAKVAERTAALERSQQALQQAQKMEAIGNLTGGIAHDFNNLLQGVTGSLDLIRRKPDDVDRVRRWAEAGLQASERGAKLTAQLLAFSRSQKLELKPLDVTQLLSGMHDLLSRTLGPSVNVTINPDAEAANVMGDETQLELAVLNLAINARDAMPNGGELVIATHRHNVKHDADLEPGEYIELTVTDSGTGMATDVTARAFDPFFTTKGVGKGTGLGLSQVYGMARQAGGIARIASRPGEGTTVRIFLRATNAAAQHSAVHAENGHAPQQKPATILIVDDDIDVRRFLADSLDAFGYQVVQAENGSEGLAALTRATPEMMIVDYAMPGMTGAEVAQKARATHPMLPIVFASGYAETSALENVADEQTIILRKPFRISELQDAVNRALGR